MAAILLLGGKITVFTYSAAGFKMAMRSNFSYPREIIVNAAGPCVGLLVCFITAKLGFTVFSGMSLVLSLFNLLPLSLLDGGKILHCMLLLCLAYETAEHVTRIVDICVLILFFAFSVYMVVYFGNITLLCASAVLLFIYCQEK